MSADTLQVHADGEEALNDLVVQVTRDAFAIGQHGQLPGVPPRGGQRQGDRGVLGEVGDRFQVADPLSVCQPTSWAADRFVRSLPAVDVLPARGFCTDRADFDEWAGRQRSLRLENFYRDARRRCGLLMDGDQPAEGRWNFDADNREPAPRSGALAVPAPWQPDEDDIDGQVRADLDRWEREGAVQFVGRDGPREFPVTAAEAQSALRVFLRDRLPHFGPHEDAMLSSDRFMAHSLLSAPMNLGLLDPLDCVYAAEDAYRAGGAAAPVSRATFAS